MTDPDHKAITIVDRPGAIQAMSPIVAAAMAAGPDPATLRELLAVQREWEAGEARKAYTRAMVELKRDLPAVLARDSTVDYTSSKGRTHYAHTSLASAVGQLIEPMTQHGFSHSWETSNERGAVTVSCVITHAEGHSGRNTLTAPPDVSGNKNPAQAVASTVTLLSRYTLLSLLGIATADMTEPTGEGYEPPAPAPPGVDPEDAVNTNRNKNVASALADHGKTPEEAEALVGRSRTQWRKRDLDEIGAWVRAGKPAPADEPEDLEAAAAASDAAMAGK